MKKKNTILSVIFLIIIVLLFINFFFLQMLNLQVYPDGNIFLQQRIIPGEQFVLRYTHSVAQTPVWEIFEIDKKGQLILVETDFYDHGAGLPYSCFGDEIFVNEEGKFKIKNMSRKILLPLYYRVGQTRENYIFLRDQKINLSEKLGDSVITIDIIHMNLLNYTINKFRIGGHANFE